MDAGYSLNVMLQQSQWCEATGFTGSHVNWRTLEAPATTCLCFVCRASLRDGVVGTTVTTTPTEYDRLWKQYRIDEYLQTWAELRSKRTSSVILP